MSDREFHQLVTRFVEVCGEHALHMALQRALLTVPQRPVDPTLRHLIPPGSHDRAVQIDRSTLRDAMTRELQTLLRPH